jgi:hypothetical protein
MNIYLLVATVSLAFQLGVLALLLVGFGFKQRLRFRLHGIFMLTAVTLHLIIIGAIMVPSFVALYLEKAPILPICSRLFMRLQERHCYLRCLDCWRMAFEANNQALCA